MHRFLLFKTDETKFERQRAIRTSTLQHTVYVEFLEEFPEMICEKKDPLLPEDYFAKKWKGLADMLNSCEKGPTKSAQEWQNVSNICSLLINNNYPILMTFRFRRLKIGNIAPATKRKR